MTAAVMSPEARAVAEALIAAGQLVIPPAPQPRTVPAPPMFAEPEVAPGADLRRELAEAILWHSKNTARSLQTALGPSEIGEPCLAKLARKMLDWPVTNPDTDPLPSLVGTGAHGVLEQVFGHPRHNGRYLVEQRVVFQPPANSGTLDLYDTHREAVIDAKFPGATSMRTAKNVGPSVGYRTQVHVYGLGVRNSLGRTPKEVAIAYYPRGGLLTGMHLWCEPWDEALAVAALKRKDDLLLALTGLDVENHSERWAAIPMTESHCAWCPWHSPGSTDLSVGCPGA
jgi:hypothetical protein